MKVVIQRVASASVIINGHTKREIKRGLLVLLGIEESDSQEDTAWLVGKISRLRIFNDAEGIMNLSVEDIQGEILVISQFTLHASTKKGNRPSYIKAAKSEVAVPIYKDFIHQLRQNNGLQVITGEFGAEMQVELINDGPVTLIIDTKNKE